MNREARAEYNRRWREANPGYSRRWAAAHPDKRRETWRRWKAVHLTARAEYERRYREEHQAGRAAQYRAWRAANLERVREKDRCYHAAARAEALVANPDKVREKDRTYRAALKAETFSHYGGTCTRTGEHGGRLEIHHKNFDGEEHRKEIGRGATKLHCYLKRNGWPKGFEVLCETHHREIHREHRAATKEKEGML